MFEGSGLCLRNMVITLARRKPRLHVTPPCGHVDVQIEPRVAFHYKAVVRRLGCNVLRCRGVLNFELDIASAKVIKCCQLHVCISTEKSLLTPRKHTASPLQRSVRNNRFSGKKTNPTNKLYRRRVALTLYLAVYIYSPAF
jgi:hypothetical protein